MSYDRLKKALPAERPLTLGSTCWMQFLLAPMCCLPEIYWFSSAIRYVAIQSQQHETKHKLQINTTNLKTSFFSIEEKRQTSSKRCIGGTIKCSLISIDSVLQYDQSIEAKQQTSSKRCIGRTMKCSLISIDSVLQLIISTLNLNTWQNMNFKLTHQI
jgi:predicted proteasome-type protease